MAKRSAAMSQSRWLVGYSMLAPLSDGLRNATPPLAHP